RWYGSSTDIDQLKRAEDRLAVVLASIRDGFVAVDKDLVVVAINPAAERMFGIRAKDAVGHELSTGGPALRELADHLRQAPGESDLPLRTADCIARIQRNQDGGHVMVLHRPETTS
ncbi:MAG TPA: PAS domain-containing protein, partial [Kofleriaceae bacterium]|nr:PAS domain-containing protein [Kofleriaceae bacterium]